MYINHALNNLKSNNVFISMDSNAKSRVWFSSIDDNRGDTVNEFVAQNNLSILNDNPLFTQLVEIAI